MNKPQDYQKLFMDMNSFFASVEQQVHPPLRGEAIGIAPYTGNSGCIIAASQEAKKAGIKTGCKVGEAKRIYPQIKILESRPALYQLYHQEIIKTLFSFSPFVKILSIDEMTIPLDQDEQNRETALKIGNVIKAKIKEKVGDYLTCSVGAGPNQFLAKAAAESKKPDGLTIVSLKELPSFYQKMGLLNLCGINVKMQYILNKIGIKTALDFYQAKMSNLVCLLGHPGKMWYLRLRGFEVDNFISKTATVGRSCVLTPQYRHRQGAEKVLIKLAAKVAYRLRKERLLTAGLSLYISFLGQNSQRQFCKIPTTSNSHDILRTASNLFNKINFNAPPILIYLTAFHLSSGQKPRSLFANLEKITRTSEAMDQINDQFGPETVSFAKILDIEDAAPDRIPFGRPRYEVG